ncbi:MAG: toll/interleukin-1 receptor domain-containing protein [Candidatus Accumulibacter sp.]|nr:toll/interleukin-1 receptor domain-containing protein [Accumulibacter sp.]
MGKVFLSYSTRDHYFADLADIKLAESGITLWRDRSQLRAGADWQSGIERGIADCFAVLIALSANSAESSYVTYEWAYALGNGKTVIPMKLTECVMHPRLQAIQHLDFSVPGALPWESLVARIREVEIGDDSGEPAHAVDAALPADEPDGAHVRAILAYLNQRGYQMASFERLRTRLEGDLSDDRFREIVARNATVFRPARLKGGKPGLAKLVP